MKDDLSRLPRRNRWPRPALLSAPIAFALFVTVVLIKSPALPEPDDYPYRASIVALSHGEILLNNAQYLALKSSLTSMGGQGVLQWHPLASRYWITEKNPVYSFFAVLFYALGLLRLAPLFYGALACAGTYIGVRRWVSERASQIAVWIDCFSGAALTFAWRDTMPSFSDASLIAAGFGLLIWVLLATEASNRRRLWVGLAAFVSLECAVFIRHTNCIEFGVAVMGVTVGALVVAAWFSFQSMASSAGPGGARPGGIGGAPGAGVTPSATSGVGPGDPLPSLPSGVSAPG